ncbi:uncharacterized protein LOC142563879 isoform X2 [Dermacentor variabilis]|uniref:uncharacterized protein LOC142563879 isoform X2 n=1 Tax=Dermacentor variabilis TaxID=34621 RepID=UPI003F5B22E2
MPEFPEIPLPGNESLNEVVRDLLSGNKSLSQIQVNSDYVITWNGFFNVIEVVLAASLFLVVHVMAGGDSTLRCLATVAFAMAVQGVHFLLCGLFSPVVTISVATSFYITAVVLAGVHLVHAIYCLTGSVTRHHNIKMSDLEDTFADLVH